MGARALVCFGILVSHSGFLAGQPAPACAVFAAGSLERAGCHGRQKEWSEAEAAYRAFLKTHGGSVPGAAGHIAALLRLQQASLRQHKVEAAAGYAVAASQELRELVAAHPDEPAVLRLQADVLGNLEKDPRGVEAALTKITRIAPRDGEGWSQLGSFYLDSQKVAEGVRCFEQAVVLDSANPLYRAGLARGYAAAGRQAEAEKTFAEALKAARPGSNPHVYLWYGDFLGAAGKYDESAEAYSRVIEADPGDGEARLKRAAAEEKAGRYRTAEKDALEALAGGARERDVESLLVRVYRGLGDETKARAAAAAVERAGEADEERRAKWRRARNALEQGERLMKASRFSEALPYYASVTAEVPDYADAWFAAGVCYAQTGDGAHAEQAFRSFLRLAPSSAEGHSALGVLLLAQQRTEEARAELQEALRLDPSSEEAKEALGAATAR